jgi:hypothetical protein
VRYPNFFIVGAPRCGTGSLWTYLKGHPEIFMPPDKELYFFDSDLWGRKEWAPTLEQYLGYFSAAGNQKKVGEATPSYLRSRRAPSAIKVFSPTAQIIIMLRNPVDVMYSLHSRAVCDGTEPICEFEAALEADVTRTGRDLMGYRQSTDFPGQVQRYFDLFGRENVHTIIFDDLKENSAAVCQSTLRFLGVSLDFAAEFPWIHSNKQVRSARLQTIFLHPPRSLRSLARALLPRRLRSRMRQTLLKSNVLVRPRPPMDPELRERLRKEFAPKIEQLSKLLGRDLSAWSEPGPLARRETDKARSAAPHSVKV